MRSGSTGGYFTQIAMPSRWIASHVADVRVLALSAPCERTVSDLFTETVRVAPWGRVNDNWEIPKIASASDVTIVMSLIFNFDETLMAWERKL